MRNPLSLFEMYRGRRRPVKPHPANSRAVIHGRSAVRRVFLALGVSILALGSSRVAQAQPSCPPLSDARSHRDPPFSCRFDATLTRLFTPPTVPAGTYRVYVTGASFHNVLAAFRAVAGSTDVQGAWVPRDMNALDAYGEAGPYDHAKLARLYAGSPARVTRGPVLESGQTVASITLVSPYPDASLTRLEAGTMIIEFRIGEK